MDLKQGLWQKQTLKLAMTQELTQAIALLQYSTQELVAFLEEKAIDNPLLQVEHKNIRSIDRSLDARKKARPSNERDQKNWIEQLGESSYTVQEHLLFQLNLIPLQPAEYQVIQFFIKTIDDNGYLGTDCEEACSKLGIPLESVEHSLQVLQRMEPAGVGARNLQECLLLQIEREFPSKIIIEQNQESTTESELNVNDHVQQQLIKTIISDHFILFAEKKWKLLAKILKIDLKEIQKAFDYVQSLNPRPGSDFQKERAAYVVPDVIVKREDGHLTVGLFDESIPKVTFNEKYYQQLASYQDPEVSRFLQDKQNDFQWIYKSLEQRRETLMKVALKLVEKQTEFFQQGPAFLKPMTMREVSEELEIHESTVSRTVREKFIQTPVGTYEMKSLFSSSIKTTEQEQTSSRHAKEAIELLVKSENKQKPLSDQEIVALLIERSGIVISRRTVAKYREQQGIQSSSKRKRFE